MKFYIASGWFNPTQRRQRDTIVEILTEFGFDFYSPEAEIVVSRNADAAERRKVFESNVAAILECDIVLVNTQDKDIGTIFEAGASWAYGKPILYFCEGLSGPFNIMLAASGKDVATTFDEIRSILHDAARLGELPGRGYSPSGEVV